jgi:hypothetical protein
MASETENEAGKARRHRLLATAQRFNIRAQLSKEDIQQIEHMPSASRPNLPTHSQGLDQSNRRMYLDLRYPKLRQARPCAPTNSTFCLPKKMTKPIRKGFGESCLLEFIGTH